MQAPGEGGSGHMGPYRRRQLHQTLPGEYTQEQLNQVNAMRRKRGLPPLGGPPPLPVAQPNVHQIPMPSPLPQSPGYVGIFPGEGPGAPPFPISYSGGWQPWVPPPVPRDGDPTQSGGLFPLPHPVQIPPRQGQILAQQNAVREAAHNIIARARGFGYGL